MLWFRVLDPHTAASSARVRYTGLVPDPFREGRGVMVQGAAPGRTTCSSAEKDSMVTKCPSKFQVAPPRSEPRSGPPPPEDLMA